MGRHFKILIFFTYPAGYSYILYIWYNLTNALFLKFGTLWSRLCSLIILSPEKGLPILLCSFQDEARLGIWHCYHLANIMKFNLLWTIIAFCKTFYFLHWLIGLKDMIIDHLEKVYFFMHHAFLSWLSVISILQCKQISRGGGQGLP